jgi:hypothetical protein
MTQCRPVRTHLVEQRFGLCGTNFQLFKTCARPEARWAALVLARQWQWLFGMATTTTTAIAAAAAASAAAADTNADCWHHR